MIFIQYYYVTFNLFGSRRRSFFTDTCIRCIVSTTYSPLPRHRGGQVLSSTAARRQFDRTHRDPRRTDENRTTVYATVVINNVYGFTTIISLSTRESGKRNFNISQSVLLQKSPSNIYNVCRPQGKVSFARGTILFQNVRDDKLTVYYSKVRFVSVELLSPSPRALFRLVIILIIIISIVVKNRHEIINEHANIRVQYGI
jgi:hypothetical protein